MIEIFLLAVALAMDCFTVSMAAGMIAGRRDGWLMVRLAFLFGLYQAAMPLLGWLLMHLVDGEAIRQVDHWIAFSMLAFIGGKMVFDAFSEDKDQPALDVSSWKARHLLAVATSIDAFSVGFSLALNTPDPGLRTIGPLAEFTFAFTLLSVLVGLPFGNLIGRIYGHLARMAGGLILMAIGFNILF